MVEVINECLVWWTILFWLVLLFYGLLLIISLHKSYHDESDLNGNCLWIFIQLPEFCSRDSSLVVKEIFGVTEYVYILLHGESLFSLYLNSFFGYCPFYYEDFCPMLVISIVFCFLVSSEDADSLRIHTLSATGDIESIQKMVDDLDIEQGPSSSSWVMVME